MSVFRYFLKLAWRFKWIIILYTAVFLFNALMSSSSGNQASTVFEESRLELFVVAPQQSDEVSMNLVDYLQEHHQVHLIDASQEELEERLFAGEADGAVIIPDNLEATVKDNIASVKVLSGKSLKAIFLHEMVGSFLRFSHALLADGSYSATAIQQVMEQKAVVRVQTQNVQTDNSLANRPWGQVYFAYTSYAYIAIFIAVFGLVFSALNEENFMRRLVLGKKSRQRVSAEQFLAGLVVVAVIYLFYTAVGLLVQPSFITSEYLAKSLLLSAAFALTSYALAFLGAVIIGKNRYLYSGLSVVLAMGLSFISGLMVPIEYLSSFVLSIAKLFPNYYAIQASLSPSSDFASYATELAIIVAFGVFYGVIALAISRYREARGVQYQ